jgi:hypothetical protein
MTADARGPVACFSYLAAASLWQVERFQVTTTATVDEGCITPQVVVAGDGQDTRTMFPYLPGVAEGLACIDLAPLASAALAYIDSYRFMTAPAARAIAAARGRGPLARQPWRRRSLT